MTGCSLPAPAGASDDDRRERLVAERRLFAAYRSDSVPHVGRDEVVDRFLPLARQLAHRHSRPPEPFEDVYQVACLALVKAVERYDPKRETAFSSYAVPTIVGEIKRYYRDHTWVVHVPRDLAELALRVERTRAQLTSRLGRPATVREIASQLGVDEAEVTRARAALDARRPGSLDAGDSESDDAVAPGPMRYHGMAEPGFERAERRAVLAGMLRHLTPRERTVVCLYFDGDLTQLEIGERMGISQMQVSRILGRSLERLRGLPREHSDPRPEALAA